MHSRRFFLQSTAAGLLATRMLPTFAVASPIHCLKLSSEHPCGDISAFVCHEPLIAGEHTTTQLRTNDVANLTQCLKTESLDVVYGLGTSAEQLIVAQLISEMAADFEFTKVFSGRHQHSNNTLHHQLNGENHLLDLVSTGLEFAGASWSRALDANLLAGIQRIYEARDNKRRTERTIITKLCAPHDSPRLLHSWMFIRSART